MSEAAAGRMHEPEEAHGVTTPTPHHAINYLMIFYLLVALTIITVLVSMKRFENEMVNVLLALLVAFIKATFVARFFMHLKFEGKLIRCILFVPLVLTVLLICALIPDVGRGLHHVFHAPPIIMHDAQPLTHY